MRTENSGERKRVVILGATGSIGESALKVARDIPDRMEIVGLAANSNAEKLAAAANETRAQSVCLVDETKIDILTRELEYKPRILAGQEGLLEIARLSECGDGAGRDRRYGRIASGAGGDRGWKRSRRREQGNSGDGRRDRDARGAREWRERACPWIASTMRFFSAWKAKALRMSVAIILTASGGPFRETPRKDFDSITPEQALKHPTWNMGPKITIDSATLFNKGLEMIEAHWLFGVEMKRVEVVIHPQSIVHSMVEFADGSTLAQLSYSNMCFPIQYAVTWPDRVPNTLPPLDFSKLSRLEFFTPRYEDFPALNLARRAGETGGTLPAVMNAANEVAVAGFLDRQVRFPEIWQIVEEVMNRHTSVAHPDLDAILQADQWARKEAHGQVKSISR